MDLLPNVGTLAGPHMSMATRPEELLDGGLGRGKMEASPPRGGWSASEPSHEARLTVDLALQAADFRPLAAPLQLISAMVLSK